MRTSFLLATIATIAVPAISRAQAPDTAYIRTELQAIADAWNRNDLDRHVAPYADSATMMGNNGLIWGRPAIRALLERGFWREGKAMQQLRFEDIVIRLVGGNNAAIVTGRFILTGGGRPDASGRFSTIWEKKNGKWMTVHDHSG
jgi:ketosteroid isomerase-like protein